MRYRISFCGAVASAKHRDNVLSLDPSLRFLTRAIGL
jgi:hypothetical protein